MIQKIVITVLLICALLFLIVFLAWTFQERIAFQPPAGPWQPAPDGLRAEYEADDGQHLFAYVVGDRTAPTGVLLSFHGNADLAVRQIHWAEEVALRTGVTVVLAEYRGYMGLEGRPAYTGSQADADGAYRFVRDSLRVAPARIAFFGHSLGSAIATELAARQQPAALLLQAPFTSARDMAGRMVGYDLPDFLWRVVSRLHFDTGAKVAQVQAPVSVAHGGQDRLIPPGMGEAVYRAARVKGEWLLVPDAAHNDVSIRGGEAYWTWIGRALLPLTE